MPMAVRPSKKKSKNRSYISHDFIISNHGDIVSIIASTIIMGLLYRGTNPLAQNFVFIQHNITEEDTPELYNQHTPNAVLYTMGRKDFCVIFFYTLLCIVGHAVIQEYVFDRILKNPKLTKVKISKLNESAHLSYFYALSVFWAVYNIVTENLVPTLSSLWEGYPHSANPFWTKLFLIAQISFWLHDFPELYFQKVKKELIAGRIVQALLHLFLIVTAYVGGLTKLCMVLVSLHYATDIFLHVARVFHLVEVKKVATISFTIWNALFIPIRMVSTILAFLTLHYGLGKESVIAVDLTTGNFNTPRLRFTVMVVFFIAQASMLWNFITFHQKRLRNKQMWKSGPSSTNQDPKRKDKKKGKRDEDLGSETVVDSFQGTRREVHRRKPVNARS